MKKILTEVAFLALSTITAIALSVGLAVFGVNMQKEQTINDCRTLGAFRVGSDVYLCCPVEDEK